MMTQNGLLVVGVDVAKDKVDVCIRSLSQRRTFESTAEGRRQLVCWLRKHKVTKAVMEASGGYEREWAKALREKGVEVRIVDPKRVRHFARSAGRLAKNDAIDADMICRFAETFGEAPSQAYDAAREQLQQMVSARQGLLDIQTTLRNRGEHDVPQVVKQMHARLLKNITAELTKLKAAIIALVKATPDFARLADIIESVPGLSHITSAGLIAAMPELGQVSDEAIAALLGVAPYDDDSGKRRGERHINGGRRRVRNLFYMSCMGAATLHNPPLKAFLRSLDRQGQTGKGRPGRLHAQADRHSQHHDHSRRKVGCQPLCGCLTSAPTALGTRPSAWRANRLGSGRGQGRQPPKAVARSASLEAGRSPGYFNTVAPR